MHLKSGVNFRSTSLREHFLRVRQWVQGAATGFAAYEENAKISQIRTRKIPFYRNNN